MKKAIITIFLIGALLSACKPSDEQTNTNNQLNKNDDQAAEIVEPIEVVAPNDEPAPAGQVSTTATCTAVSEEKVELTQEGDWISGVTEGYSVTLTEYGDYQ